MVLSDNEVFEIISKGVQPKIEIARKQARKMNMHVTGLRVAEYLESLDDYETNAQKILREKLMKSNRSLFSFLLRPIDKIFTAKGGSINYNVSQDKVDNLKRNISDISDGLDIKKYLKKVVKKQYIIDPNGILFVDIDKEGMIETHIINTNQIFWYENKGNIVKAIIFEAYKKELTKQEIEFYEKLGHGYLKSAKERRYFRVIDSETDRIFVKDGDDVYVEKNSTIPNYFGYVPAKILGDEKSPNFDIFESILQDVVEDADEYLRDLSVKTVHKLSHAYPLYYALEQACTRCGGEGVIKYQSKPEDEVVERVCTSCGGTGEKTRINPSDKLIIKAPQEGDAPLKKENIAGTISPNLETAKFYEDNIEKMKNGMFQSVWGTTYEQGGKRETATGRFLDAQPVKDRLRDVSDTFSKLHKFLLDCYGKVVLRNPKYESSVSYGDRYILETPDDILKKYQEATNYPISEIINMDLRNQYFDGEFQNDPVSLTMYTKLSKIEPFPTMTPESISKIEWIPPVEKAKKLYYSTWVSTLTKEKAVILSEEELRQDFENYINSKQLNLINNVEK